DARTSSSSVECPGILPSASRRTDSASLEGRPKAPTIQTVGHRAAMVVVDHQPALERRHGALRAVGPFADAARYADRVEAGAVGKVEIVGIDEVARMRHLAAHRDDIAPLRRAEASAALRYLGCKAKVAHTVRGFGELPDDAPRRLESLMHVPQRAGRTEACELQLGGAVPLGDVAGAV